MRSRTQREPVEASAWTDHIITTAASINSVLRLILNTVPVPLWVASSGSECTFVNRRWTEFTGRTAEAELGWGWVGGVHAEDRKRVLETIEEAVHKGCDFECEYRLRRHDGEFRQMFSRGMPPIVSSQNFGYVGIAWDITRKNGCSATQSGATANEADRFRERLLQASARAVNAEERERRRISRELHDDFGQRIAGVCSRLGAMMKASKKTTKREVLAATAASLEELIAVADDLRTVAHQLHPAIIDLLGPVDAMRSLCRDTERLHGIKVTFESSLTEGDFSHSTAIAFYRILQEGLANAIKHAQASNISVILAKQGDTVRLRICDDGQGFDQSSARPGLGLVTMEERALCLAGRFCIGTAPGGGCTVCVELPTRPPDELAA